MSSFSRFAPALRIALVLGLLGLASALILWPLRGPDWPTGHYEGMRYLALTEHFRRALRATAAYPRWLPDLYGGRGYPTFVFYQPLIFFVGTLWRSAFYGTSALWATLWSFLVVGGFGAYLLGLRHGGPLWGLTVAGIFLLSPYLYVDLFVRQALAELSSLMLLPWVLLALELLRDRTESGQRTLGAVGLLAASVAALIYSHPLTSALFCIFVQPFIFVLCWRGRRFDPQIAARVVLGFGLAVLLSAPYWLPFKLMQKEVNLEAAFNADFATHHTVFWSQFFSRAWGFGGSVPDSPDDGMSFQLGAVHFGLASIAVLSCRRKALSIGAFVAYLAAIVAMTPWCARLWSLPVFREVQFPWRTLAVTTALQSLILARAGEVFSRLRWPGLRLLVAVALLGGVYWRQQNQFQTGGRIEYADAALRAEVRGARSQILRYCGVDEFRPKTTPAGDPRPLGDAPILSAASGVLEFEPKSNAYHLVADLWTSEDTYLRLLQLYLPGWQVTLNGNDIPDEELRNGRLRNGTMRVNVKVPTPGETARFHIEARYAGPRGAGAANGLVTLALLSLVGFGLWERSRQELAQARRRKV